VTGAAKNGLLLVAFLATTTSIAVTIARPADAALPPSEEEPPSPPPDAAPAPPPDTAPDPISVAAATSVQSSPSAPAGEGPPPPQELPPEYAPPSPPPYEPPLIPRYGDRGTAEVSLGLGYSSVSGFLGAGGFRYFVADGLAPGVEGTYVAGGRNVDSYGLALGSLRFVPVRGPTTSLVLTARAGRVFLSDHADGWGAGAGGGVLFGIGGGAGVELGYQFLRLLPSSFCADLSTCVLHGPVLGLRLMF
jgi:hypothetical protein